MGEWIDGRLGRLRGGVTETLGPAAPQRSPQLIGVRVFASASACAKENLIQKYGIGPEVEDAEKPLEMTFEDAIRIIQTHERARQGHVRAHWQREIKYARSRRQRGEGAFVWGVWGVRVRVRACVCACMC